MNSADLVENLCDVKIAVRVRKENIQFVNE